MSEVGRRPLTILKRIAPWAIALLALGWVFRSIDRHQLVAALEHAPVAAFVAVSALMPVQERRRVVWQMPAGAPRAPGLKSEPHP